MECAYFRKPGILKWQRDKSDGGRKREEDSETIAGRFRGRKIRRAEYQEMENDVRRSKRSEVCNKKEATVLRSK